MPCFTLQRFNSKLVRLKGRTAEKTKTSPKCFNSKLVRLKAIVTPSFIAGYLSFNSKLVRLKAFLPLVLSYQVLKRCFNSKLVRLKAVRITFKDNTQAQFQFQTGSIKSRASLSVRLVSMLFQFQTGSIKSFRRVQGRKCRHGFNSKLVRLKVRMKLHMLSTKLVSIPNWFD